VAIPAVYIVHRNLTSDLFIGNRKTPKEPVIANSITATFLGISVIGI
jgi:hypothetical protein